MKRLMLVTCLLLMAAPLCAQDTVAIVIEQPDAPLRIVRYEARHVPGGIRHEVEYENIGTRKVVASQIGLVSFSIFNDFLDFTAGVDMSDVDPGRQEKGAWIAKAFSDFTFYTGVAYVRKVRFEDGHIWESGLSLVLEELRTIEENFDAARLGADTSADEN